MVNKVIYNWFIPVDLNSGVETCGFSFFFDREGRKHG